MHQLRLFPLLAFAAVGFYAACAGAPGARRVATLEAVDVGIRQACEGLAVALQLQSPGVDAEHIINTTCRVEENTRKLRDAMLTHQLDLARAAGVILPDLALAPELQPFPDRPGDAGTPQ